MYRQIVTHNRRAAMIFVVDCSLSMLQPTRIGALECSKIKMCELICNMMIDELVLRSQRHGEARNYYDIAVLGYSNNGVESLLAANTDGFISVDRLMDLMPQPVTITTRAEINGEMQDIPFTYHPWITPRASGSTSMLEALAQTCVLADTWCRKPDNINSFPPIVFHITDGGGNDSSSEALIDMAARIMSTHTEDGNTLLFTTHLSSDVDGKQHIFPNKRSFKTTDRDRMLLFKMSSIVPKCLEPSMVYLLNLKHKGPYCGLMSNLSPCDLISLLSSGTKSAHHVRNR